ncbi:hypothetical protein COO59_07340 [Mixta theicola]|uniref:Type II secretion system protein L n=1 Tax=Mixta theicola TaxID=1458355 RepID=A0A2K1QB95_9GAMM|nr:type II secretion system protein GspL [Mixta theicola]PNS12308.1 hypothetical protein COO59_07340 [Mixta theicola]GLR08065.1 type II secretion system protein L [Mixta theicola]
MPGQLFIRPSLSVNERVEWLYQTQGDAPVSGELTDMTQLNRLQTYAADAEVILLVPGEMVICLPAALPLMVKAKLNKKMLKALPYQIEEQIIGPVEDLHWTVISFKSPYYLLGISQQQLQQWQTLFIEGLLPLHRIIPDSFCLPVAPDEGWSLLYDNQRCIVRQHEYRGLVLKAGWLVQLAGYDQVPVDVYGNEFSATPPARWQHKVRGETLDILAYHSLHSHVNLLEKPLRIAGKQTLPGWRIVPGIAAAGLLAICIGLLLSGQNYWQQAARLEEKNIRLYQALTHTQKKISNPRFHLMQRLKSKADHSPHSDFRQVMLKIAEARNLHPEVTISRLRYSAADNLLQLTAEGKEWEAFSTLLNAQPVYQQSVTGGNKSSLLHE